MERISEIRTTPLAEVAARSGGLQKPVDMRLLALAQLLDK